ncbi:FAD-dependent oxidoreductase [Caproiciproducens sp. MSJ-32]|uniref:FAD-dependent oxidoreductase n=1 Tax=Caproiciproducens sp. MSJ-32 TaxID=2841527 RepID=UPI001C0F5EF6|nr:FAD-dependent oxidoreductase [Caproiciproducens sp. MSJ-32]MBU5454672.1 FAD-dependent oxidoreductase [Caproiciproducens sp. MSJ-32]
MKHLELKKDIYWIGALDPNLRVFDIIMYTPYGTSYNSYVVKGSEKIALFETVKVQFFDQYLERLKSLNIDITKIDYIIVDHTEPDHAGSVAKLLELSPNAKIVGSATALSFLKDIANRDFEAITVKHGSEISLGNKTLRFISAPFLHWPDSIYTYLVEDEVLITCDSFGSHYSSENIINSKVENREHYMEALKYYYDMIFGPFKPYVLKAIDKIKDLKIDMILPGHGPVLVENPMEVVELYKEWSTPKEDKNKNKIVSISYVSAYGYTETLAKEIARGIESVENTEVRLFNIIENDIDNIVASIEESEGILFGSPTIVSELLPPVRDVLTKLNPVIHGGKLAAAFGSYGWSGEAIPRIETRLNELNMKLFGPSLKIKFKPSDEELKEAFEFGVKFAETLIGKREFIPFDKEEEDTKKKSVDDTPSSGKLKLWKCIVCGEIFEAETVPNICPVCGAGSDQFIEIPREENKFTSDTKESIIIIGNGAAGFYAAKAIRERNINAVIKLISNEPEHSYVRTQLSDLITEEPDSTFYLEKENWYKENNIIEILGVNVNSIDKDKKTIKLDNNEEIKYDKLILANGSYNFVPPTKVKYEDSEIEINSENYKTLKGVHTIKKLADVKVIKNELPNVKDAIVIGGGLLGLEAAWELQKKNIKVTVIELADRLLPRQLDTEGSNLFKNIITNSPVEILLGEAVDFINADKNGVKSIQLKSGKLIKADMIIYSVGVRSNIALAKTAGIECNRGIIVDESMRTNLPDIYACGDVAELNGIYYGNWPAAIEMGKVAGANSVGDDLKFEKFVSSTIFAAMETNIFSAGSINFDDPSLEKIASINPEGNKYIKLFFNNNKLVGGILIGDLSPSVKIIEGIQNGYDKTTMLSKNIFSY